MVEHGLGRLESGDSGQAYLQNSAFHGLLPSIYCLVIVPAATQSIPGPRPTPEVYHAVWLVLPGSRA